MSPDPFAFDLSEVRLTIDGYAQSGDCQPFGFHIMRQIPVNGVI